MDIPEPGDVERIANMPFVVMYWPLVVGAILFFLALARGYTWIAVPIAAVAIAVQAARLGVFS